MHRHVNYKLLETDFRILEVANQHTSEFPMRGRCKHRPYDYYLDFADKPLFRAQGGLIELVSGTLGSDILPSEIYMALIKSRESVIIPSR